MNSDQWLAALFAPSELPAFKRKPTDSALLPAPHQSTEFFLLNPVKSLFGDASLDNIAVYKNFLIEFDGMNSLEEQWSYAKEVELPWTTCTYSGGKSLHFIISLTKGLANADLYHYSSRALVNIVEGADTSSSNANRLTRTPNALRDGSVLQELIEVRKPITQLEFVRWCVMGPLKNKYEAWQQKLRDEELAQQQRAAMKPAEGMTIIPTIYRQMIEAGAMHPECNSRHQSLTKFAVWLDENWHDKSEIEGLLHEAASGLGIDGRGDVEGILRWLRRR